MSTFSRLEIESATNGYVVKHLSFTHVFKSSSELLAFLHEIIPEEKSAKDGSWIEVDKDFQEVNEGRLPPKGEDGYTEGPKGVHTKWIKSMDYINVFYLHDLKAGFVTFRLEELLTLRNQLKKGNYFSIPYSIEEKIKKAGFTQAFTPLKWDDAADDFEINSHRECLKLKVEQVYEMINDKA